MSESTSPSVPCPQCGASATGNFCSTCGASLGVSRCPSCGEVPAAGGRFCNLCGAVLGAAGSQAPPRAAPNVARAAPRAASEAASTRPKLRKGGGATPSSGESSNLGWWTAGAFMVALIVIVAYPIVAPDATAPPPVVGPSQTGAGAVDLESMTPRQAADRLFNRVMGAAEQGDSSQVQFFMPMALQAYEQAAPLDADGVYHVALLHHAAGDFQAALAAADEALVDDPDHLLLLAAAGLAARSAGDMEAARQAFGRFLEVYDAEMASGRVEYGEHQGILPQHLETAREVAGG